MVFVPPCFYGFSFFFSGKLCCGLHALKNARSVASLSTSPLLDRNCEDSMDKTCHCYQIPLFYAPYHLLESRFLCTYWQTTQRNRSPLGQYARHLAKNDKPNKQC